MTVPDSTGRAPHPRVAVIGAGISGLSAAHRLGELIPDAELALFDGGDQPGGLLRSIRRDDFLMEQAADGFLSVDPVVSCLCQRLSHRVELISASKDFQRAYVVRGGRLHPVPTGFVVMAPRQLVPLLTTPILGSLGKLRAVCEPFIARRRDDSDESIASFVRRRLGTEVYERLVQPLVGGIFTGDPEQLSIRATMPRFIQMEREHGSLLRAAWRERATSKTVASGARYELFQAPRHGMSALVSSLVDDLPAGVLKLRAPVKGLARTADGWRLTVDSRSIRTWDADAVIVATPPRVAAQLLHGVDAEMSRNLSSIGSVSSAVVIVGYRQSQISRPLDGFGFVVPLIERRKILSASLSSVKFSGRAPEGTMLIRVFLGGACQPDVLKADDCELVRMACDELAELMGIRGEPIVGHVVRHEAAIPQYSLGHLERIRDIEQGLSRLPGLALAGNAFHGVGVPQCVRSGERAAELAAGWVDSIDRKRAFGTGHCHRHVGDLQMSPSSTPSSQ